jgi:hypothetical protein
VQPSEDPSCYASVAQRSLLVRLAEHPLICEHFFLTGGTALSALYLHHRTSEDLDLFALRPVDLSEISFWIRTVWQSNHAIVRATTHFLSMLIENVRVDIVIDPLSEEGGRERVRLGEASLMIDSLSNIGANKLCTLVSTTEPKDFVDFYFLLREAPQLAIESLLEAARKREALFDDPPTAAYQLEEGLRFLRDHTALIPELAKPLGHQEMFDFYEALAKNLYQKGGNFEQR